MSDLIKTIITSLTSKVGGFAGIVLSYVLQFFGAKLADYLNELYKKHKRNNEQSIALKKVDQDVENKLARSEEVKKNEKDFINS